MKSSSHEIYRHTAIDLEVISAIKVQSECAQATQSKEEGTPKSDPELMKLKNSNMERSDLLCPVKKVHIQFMGRKTLTVLK